MVVFDWATNPLSHLINIHLKLIPSHLQVPEVQDNNKENENTGILCSVEIIVVLY